MSSHRFRFRTRWLGYDRTEVNHFLDQVAADRQLLKDKLNYLESLAPHGAGERSARAALESQRLQLDGVKDVSKELATCLSACVAVLEKVHDQLTLEPAVPVATAAPSLATNPLQQVSQPTRPTSLTRRMAYAALAVLFVGGAGVTAVTHVPASANRSGGEDARAMHTSLPVAPPQIAQVTRPEQIVQIEPAPPSVKGGDDVLTADKGLGVILTATGPCWIRSVVDGSHPVERTMQAGETIVVWGRDEVLIRAGDGGSLTVAINGQAAVPLGRAGEVVTRRITRATLPS